MEQTSVVNHLSPKTTAAPPIAARSHRERSSFAAGVFGLVGMDDLIAGNYRILRMLGEGGMGIVFEAEDAALQRKVALKVMKPELEQDDGCQRFLREARAMASIKHDNLVTVYQVGRVEHLVFLAMELLKGESLEARLGRGDPLPFAEVVRIGRGIAGGLEAMHGSGLIHRDIKPANLWLEAGSGRVKILDFGLVRVVGGDQHLTHSGMVLGTPAYLAPEQARGRVPDHRCDLFSLGCVLYRMCTGRLPFKAADTLSQLVALAADDPVPVREANPNVPKAVARLVHRLLEKSPDDRPQSAAEVAAELGRIEAREEEPTPSSATPDAVQQRPSSRSRKRPSERKFSRKQRQRKSLWQRRSTVGLAMVAALILAGAASIWALQPPAGSSTVGEVDGESQRPVQSGAPLADSTIYLKTLQIAESAFYPFRLPVPPRPGSPEPPRGAQMVRVRGKDSPNSIFLHPVPDPEGDQASVSFKLDGKYRLLAGEATYDDQTPPGPPGVRFRVLGDGMSLWEGVMSRPQCEGKKFEVPVEGVKMLRLETRLVVGFRPMGAHAVWFEPRLTR